MSEDFLMNRLPKPPKQKSDLGRISVIILLCAILFGATGYIMGSKKQIKPEKNSSQEEVVEIESSPGPEIEQSAISIDSSWKTYSNSEYGFTLKYPSDWKLENNALNNNQLFGITLASPEMQQMIKEKKPDSAPEIVVNVFAKAREFDLTARIQDDSSYMPNSLEESTIANQLGYKAIMQGMVDSTYFFWEQGDRYFEASTFGKESDLETILSTFVFTK